MCIFTYVYYIYIYITFCLLCICRSSADITSHPPGLTNRSATSATRVPRSPLGDKHTGGSIPK